ncbi:MAG: DUF5666 domain-containing protein [Candidatus Pacebacteria bacterium]|nr:DUF5666 domain-containing protein [Candidatus Paceibacterota bacterium]
MITKDSLLQFVRSRPFTTILIGIGMLIVLLCVFEAGIMIGYREATFSSGWGANYERNFGDKDVQGSIGLPDGRGPQAFGAIGQIINVSSTTLLIQDPNHQEQKVVVDKDTLIRNQEDTVTTAALTNGSYVVVVGSPNDSGTIEAKLIRIIPAPPTNPPAMASTTP